MNVVFYHPPDLAWPGKPDKHTGADQTQRAYGQGQSISASHIPQHAGQIRTQSSAGTCSHADHAEYQAK